MKLAAMVRALVSKGIPEDTAKSAVLDIEDFADDGGDQSITREEAKVGTPVGAHGFQASPMISAASDETTQRARQAEYDTFSRMLGGMSSAMKAQGETLTKLVEVLTPKAAAVTPAVAEETYIGKAEVILKSARTELFKAETEDKEDEKDEDRVEKAERMLAKASKLLVKADEEDEDDERVEKAMTLLRKLTKSLAAIKADRAPAVKAEDKEEKEEEKEEKEVEKAAATPVVDVESRLTEVQASVGMVTKSVQELMDLVASTSRAAGTPPSFTTVKAEEKAVEPESYMAKALELADAGRMTNDELMKCRTIHSHIVMAKSTPDMLNKVKAEIKAASESVQRLFAPVLSA